MSGYSSVLGVAALLLHLWGTHSFPTSVCPVPCLCQHASLLNCSSLGLTKIPKSIPATAVSLNISNNALHSLAPLSFGHVKLKGLLHLWVGSNALENLSLVLKKDRSGTRTPSNGEQQCTSWAPDLQLLSAERNHLKHLPKGLGCMKSLQILQLSYNQIYEIGLTDLDRCSHLKELHLPHNSITSIHPRAFTDLKQLQVLDLSYNLLVTIPVPAYQSLRNLNGLINISFNKWKCDCNLQTLKRWISFDTEMGDATWQVVCASPPNHAGKDLLHLKDSELTCPKREYSTSGKYENLIVDEGMQISIPCRDDIKDVMPVNWWTPHGQVTDNHPELIIKDITEQHAGIYVCVSGVQWEQISVFDVHVYKKGSGSRLRREATIIMDEQEIARNGPVVRQTRTQSEFILAVCLSVIITFVLAFILGVLLRPLLEKLWRRIRSKRQATPAAATTTFTEPQPYVNEAYCDIEDQEREVRVNSRVTFGGITEVQDQVPYYVTVENDQADGSSESNTEAEGLDETTKNKKSSITGGKQQLEVEHHRGRADSSSSSSSSLQEGEVNALVINSKKLPPSSTEEMAKPMEFEPIPDEAEIPQLTRSSSSASSHSSQEVNLSRVIRDSTEQNVDSPTVTVNKTQGVIPGFTAEPFSDWSTRMTEQNVDDLDPELWNDSGESFSFTEGSERSSIRDLSSSALGTPLKENDIWRQGNVESHEDKIKFDSDVVDFEKFGKEVLVDNQQFELSDLLSSSNSSESEGESNNYLVNPESEEESEILDESDTKNNENPAQSQNRFNIYENVPFNERMPSAGILPRQETITLEPSDIHLTFTREDSFDESILIDDFQVNNDYVNISEKSGIFADVGLDTVPKVKRSLEFKQTKPDSDAPTLPSFSPSSKKKNILTEMEVTSEISTGESSGENRSLTQIEVSPERIQKVKRYIQFKQPEPHSLTLPSSPSLNKKDAKLEAKRYSSSSDDVALLMTKDDNFFRTMDVSFDGASKVKRYISFKEFESSTPTLSMSSTKTTTEATTKSMQPSTSPTQTNPNVKQHMYFHNSSSLPSSPTSSNKGLSGKKTKYKKQSDNSYYGSHESLPLYHVHPAYRSSINRLNRGYDTDRSISSEDEDQFMEYPRKLEITVAPGLNRGSISPNKNKDEVLNIDYDNSSSSTDVLDKKQSKGLMRLRALSARLFNRHENETDEWRSPSGLDSGRTERVSINKQSTKDQANYEDIILGKNLSIDHLPNVKRYIQFSHPYPQAQLPSLSSTTDVVAPDFIATTESRRSSFSSEDDVKQNGEVDGSYNALPKVKRYIEFSLTEPYTALPLNKESISPELVVQPETRRSSSSSEDDIKPNKDNFFRKIGISLDKVPNVKRYIQFSQPKPYSPTLSSTVSIERPVVESSATTSVKLDDKLDSTGNHFPVGLNAVPKVKRYVQFTQSKAYSSTLPPVSTSSTNVTPDIEGKTEAKTDRSTGDQGCLMQIEVSPKNIQKVKRYIHFKESEPHSQILPSSPILTKKNAILETRRYSSSSEDDAQPTTEEDNFFSIIGVSSNEVSKVKRYITFKQSEPSSPTLSASSPSTKIEKTTEEIKSKDDIRPQKDSDTFFAKSYLDKVPQVKRYITFKQTVSDLPVVPLPTTSDTLNVTPEIKSESRRSSNSSEDDGKLTAEEVNVSGETGAYFDRVPRVKRYIQFTRPESPSLTQTTTDLSSDKVNVSLIANQTRTWSTSSEEDVKPPTEVNDIIEEKGEYQIPKVKRYIKFTQSEPYYSDVSLVPPSSTVKSIKVTETQFRPPATRESTSSEEDHDLEQIGVSLNRVPRVKRYIQFTHPASQSLVQSTSVISSERVGIMEKTQDIRRSSTSSEEDDTLMAEEENVFGKTEASLDKIPKVKRYIQFANSESKPPVQTTTNLSGEILGISGVVKEIRSSNTSSEHDIKPSTNDDVQRDESFDKIPKVKRYIKFTQYEPSHDHDQFPLPSTVKSINVIETESRQSSTIVKDSLTSPKEDKIFGETEASLDRIPRVNRYIQFTHQSPDHSTTTTTTLSAEKVRISETISEITKSSSSFEDDGTLAGKKDYFVGHIGAPLDEIPKVKRYIQFTHSKSQMPVQKTLSNDRESTSMVVTRTPSKDIKQSINDGNIKETGESLNKIPKIKRYIEFIPNEPYSSAKLQLPFSSIQKMTESSTSAKHDVQPSTKENKSITQSISSDNFDRVPRVKRYIQFTPAENQYPARPSTALLAERVGIRQVAQETSSKYVKPTAVDYNITGQTDKSFADFPKVKRYIEFTESKPYSSTKLSSLTSNTVKSKSKVEAQETKKYRPLYDDVTPRRNDENFFQEIGASVDEIPKVKRYITLTKSEPPFSTTLMKSDATPITNADSETTWSNLSSELSPSVSKKKGSTVIIKTESESWKSDFRYKNNLSSDKQSVEHQVMDEPPPVPLSSPPPLEPDDSKEYLRENAEVRQRQERRRLLQQRRKEMDEFNIASLSSMQQEGDKQHQSLADYGGAPTLQTESTYSVSTRNTSRRTEGAEAPVLQGLKTKSSVKEYLI